MNVSSYLCVDKFLMHRATGGCGAPVLVLTFNRVFFNTRIAIMMTKVPSHQKIMILIGLDKF